MSGNQKNPLIKSKKENKMEVKLLIDGQDVSASNIAVFDRIDPVTGEVASTAAAGN